MKKIIAIINQKGGVGKTTTAINFSCGLANRGYKTLLIDLDPQAHSTIGLNIEPEEYNNKGAINDVLLDKKNINKVILPTKINNLDIAPSHLRLDKAENEIFFGMNRESRLHKTITNLNYDYIAIDCRPTLGNLTINALFACNFIIVPCEISRYSLDGFADLMDTIEEVKKVDSFNQEKIIKLLLTKFDSRKTVANKWIFEQLEPYKKLLFQTKIRQNETINQANIAQEPIFSFDKNSNGAEDYNQLVEEFLKI